MRFVKKEKRGYSAWERASDPINVDSFNSTPGKAMMMVITGLGKILTRIDGAHPRFVAVDHEPRWLSARPGRKTVDHYTTWCFVVVSLGDAKHAKRRQTDSRLLKGKVEIRDIPSTCCT